MGPVKNANSLLSTVNLTLPAILPTELKLDHSPFPNPSNSFFVELYLMYPSLPTGFSPSFSPIAISLPTGIRIASVELI